MDTAWHFTLLLVQGTCGSLDREQVAVLGASCSLAVSLKAVSLLPSWCGVVPLFLSICASLFPFCTTYNLPPLPYSLIPSNSTVSYADWQGEQIVLFALGWAIPGSTPTKNNCMSQRNHLVGLSGDSTPGIGNVPNIGEMTQELERTLPPTTTITTS